MDSWFSFAQRRGLGVERMQDIVLVTGCTLVTSWGAAAFMSSTLSAEVSLKTQAFDGGGASFDWSEIRPSVVFHNSHQVSILLAQHSVALLANVSSYR